MTMIEAAVTKVLTRKCPNYHVVAERFAKYTFSLCTCSKCRFSLLGTNVTQTKPERTCKPLLDRLIEDKLPIGYARVDANGTCDAAQFIPEDNRDFRLKCERAVLKTCEENIQRASEPEPTYHDEEEAGLEH